MTADDSLSCRCLVVTCKEYGFKCSYILLLSYTLLCLQVWWMPTGPEVVCLATHWQQRLAVKQLLLKVIFAVN